MIPFQNNLIKFLCLTLLVSLTSCSKKNEPKDKEGFYFISGFAPEDTKYFVNGNPTNKGNAISLFLIEGNNTINLKSEFKETGYSLRIVKTKDLFSNDFEEVINEEKDIKEAKKSSAITLKIGQWWRWTWQDCDTITEITVNDKKEILDLFDTICTAASNFETNKEFLTTHKDIIQWSEHPYFSERRKKFNNQIFSNLPPRSELVESKALREEIEFVVGKKIVMLIPTKDDKLYDLSAPPKEDQSNKNDGSVTWTYSLGFNEMFFVKKEGNWKMLMPVN